MHPQETVSGTVCRNNATLGHSIQVSCDSVNADSCRPNHPALKGRRGAATGACSIPWLCHGPLHVDPLDPGFIEAPKHDHRPLPGIIGSIRQARQASRAGDLPGLQKRVERFRIALQDHLLKEDVRLYVYRLHLLQSDAISNDLMHGFRRERDRLYPMYSPPD